MEVSRWPYSSLSPEDAEDLFYAHLPQDYAGDAWSSANERSAESWNIGAQHRRDEHPPNVTLLPGARPSGMSRPAHGVRMVVEPFDKITVQTARWFWEVAEGGLIAHGELSVLAGRQSDGKSTLAYTMAAAATRGRLPGCYHGLPVNVLVVNAEESAESVIKPRLIAARADLAKISQIKIQTESGHLRQVDLSEHLDDIEQVVTEQDIRLVLMDPLTSRMGRTDQFKDGEVRGVLEPLVAMCQRLGVTAVGVMHVSKQVSTDPLRMVMNSTAFTSVPRTVLFVQRDPEDRSHRMLSQIKNNNGPELEASLGFTIEGVRLPVTDQDGNEVHSAHLIWDAKADDRSAYDLLAEHQRKERKSIDGASERRTLGEQCADWLVKFLASAGGSGAFGATRRQIMEAADADVWKSAHVKDALRIAQDDLHRWLTKVEVVYDDGSPVENNVAGFVLTREGIAPAEDGLHVQIGPDDREDAAQLTYEPARRLTVARPDSNDAPTATALCQGTKVDGSPCPHRAQPGSTYCGYHAGQEGG